MFSSASNSFFQLSADNRLALWDVSTGELKVLVQEKRHLSAEYVCSTQRSVMSKKSRKSVAGNKSIAAVGSDEGKIVVWDLLSGDVLHKKLRLPGANSSDRITGLCLSVDGTKLYVCTSTSKYVFELDVETGDVLRKFKVGKQSSCCVCVSPDGKTLLTASTEIKVWNLESAELVGKIAAHSTPVTGLSFSPDSNLILSCCDDRFVSVWHTASEELVQREPLISMSTPSIPVSFCTSEYFLSKSKDTFLVSIYGQDNCNYIWSVSTAQASKLVSVLKCEEKTETGYPISVLFNKDNTTVIVARETPLRPIFETIDLVKKGEFIKEMVLRNLSDESNLVASSQSGKKSDGDVLGQKVHIVNASHASMANPKTTGTGNEDEGDLTIGERVQQLNDSLAKVLDESPIQSKKRPRDAKSGALTTVLEQALQSNDNSLLEICLGHVDQKIVNATVRNMSPTRVTELISSLVTKFENKPARASMLLVWIKALLDQHANYLMHAPDLADALGSLYRLVESRLSVFDKFLRLQGRLDFVITQAAIRSDKEPDVGVSEPAVIYDEEAAAEDVHEKPRKKRTSKINGH